MHKYISGKIKAAVGFALALLLAFALPHGANAETIPMLKDLQQIAPNQLKVTYDQRVDGTKGITPGNYWIQSTTETMPTGIATLGMNDRVSPGNALTADKVTITTADTTNTSFILTFKQPIPAGKSYKLIICYVTAPNAPPYSGDNGSREFTGK
ncbi:hypothetical protein [Paenibacillus sacheonensis]|uniref:Uncharacterized protein n=1 Tax=Paenibacillus sacheonensis TaxID=742054 RepID=A0A7X5C3K4_9BACL|nr:hypothetical protein [Paenibacillus sacheonensis]MBM7566827.1 hypothetical protein [Paenibacillus sacheonensis]NBC71449.1 hypothetical protein [Paenibacillus sacheonensis]